MLKKYFSLVLLASITIASCGNSDQKNTSNDPEDVKSITVSEKTSANEGKAIHISKADFLNKVMDYEANPEQWIYKGDKPCIIDFYADWCGPCKIAGPILEELAAEYKDEIYVYKVNTEVERELSSVFGIRSIPAFLLVPQNGQPTMSNGIARSPEETKEMFKKMIDEILLGNAEKES